MQSHAKLRDTMRTYVKPQETVQNRAKPCKPCKTTTELMNCLLRCLCLSSRKPHKTWFKEDRWKLFQKLPQTRLKNIFQFRTTSCCILVIRLIGYINIYPLTPEHTHNPTHNLTPLTQHERPILRLVEWLPDWNLRLVEWLPEKFLQKTFLELPQCDKRWDD